MKLNELIKQLVELEKKATHDYKEVMLFVGDVEISTIKVELSDIGTPILRGVLTEEQCCSVELHDFTQN